MKNLVSRLSVRARVAFCTVMAFLFGGSLNVAFAQAGDQDIAQEVLDSTTGKLKSLVGSIIDVLQIGLGIAALVTLVLVVINLLKGEREAASKIGWWVIGLAFGFGAMTVIGSIIAR